MAEQQAPAVANSTAVPPGTAETDWVSAHIFYQGDITELVLDGAAPLAREMTSGGLVSGWFFLRYWDGGTHLRLRVLPSSGGDRGRVQELIIERLGRYLRERPSVELIQQADYAQYAPVLAAREGMASHTESLYPNNSVVFLPYQREHDRYGHGRSVEAVERHFVESSRLAAAMLGSERGQRPGWRDTAAFGLLLLTWLVYQPNPTRLAEAGGRLYGEWGRGLDAVDEADFDKRHRRQRDQFIDTARGVCDIAARLPHQDAGRGALAWWGASVLRLRDALAREVFEGRFTPRSQFTPSARKLPPPGPDRRSPTTSGEADNRVLPVLDVCAHLLCNRLGISLVEEAYLRYLAVRSIAALAEEGRGR